MRLICSIVAIALTISACATGNLNIPTADPRRYGELVPGSSTKDEATTKLGPPNSVSALPNGNVLLQWIDVYHQPGIHVAIVFGPDGKMIGVQHVFTQ
jgi:hypothetical protein